jgi:hypothetical protein
VQATGVIGQQPAAVGGGSAQRHEVGKGCRARGLTMLLHLSQMGYCAMGNMYDVDSSTCHTADALFSTTPAVQNLPKKDPPHHNRLKIGVAYEVLNLAVSSTQVHRKQVSATRGGIGKV